MRKILVTLFLVLALGIVGGMGAQDQVVLTMPERDTPASLNPNWQNDSGAHGPTSNIFSHLVIMDWGITQGVQAYGDLAEDWEISEDGLTITFNLYDNVTWHDGEPVTSADVKYTFDTIVANEYPLTTYLSDVEEITTPDDYTVVMHMAQAAPSFIPLLAQASNWYGKILPQHIYEGEDWETSPVNESPIGSGPFKFVEWERNSHVVLEANDDYFRGRPAVDIVIFQHIPDPTVAVSLYQAGEFPYLPNSYVPSYGEIAQMMEDESRQDEVVVTPSIYGRDVYVNLQNEQLSNLEVRQAIAHAIDREAINRLAFFGLWPPIDNAGIPVLGEYLNGDAVYPEYDPELAEQLLDDAGYPRGDDGWRFSLDVTNPTIADTELIAEVLVQQLREVGIDATWQRYDSATWNEKMRAGDFDLSMYYTRYGPDPDAYWEHFSQEGPRNFMGYNNDTMNELLQEGKYTVDTNTRIDIYRQVQSILVEDLPQINLFQQTRFSFVDPAWSGFAVQEDGFGTNYSWFGVYGVIPPAE